MSYDYNALVSEIASSRRAAASSSSHEVRLQHLQVSVDTFATLSGHCPMTPLLWMQYSKDTADLLFCLSGEEENLSPSIASSARDTQVQLLELALAEFPGSAILNLYYLHILSQSDNAFDRIESSIKTAIQNVGRGSHRNDGFLVAAIYDLAIEVYARHKKMDQALAVFVQRAQTPIKDANEALTAQLVEFCAQHPEISVEKRQETLRLLDDARRYEAKTFNVLIALEDEVDVAMHNEGIFPRHQVNLETLDWEAILRSDDKLCWMGCGGMLSAKAFIQYAQACYCFKSHFRGRKKKLSKDEDDLLKEDEAVVRDLAIPVYERGIAECPTVEIVWLKYIRHLEYVVEEDASFLPRLTSAIDRSIRNCPYSAGLYQKKLNIHGTLADQDMAVFDPDSLQAIVQEAIDSKFIATKEACLELFLTAARVIRRRILFLLSKTTVSQSEKEKEKSLHYDDAEPFNAAKYTFSPGDLADSTIQEIEDLCDDCRDLYEATETYLKKNHASWPEGKGRLLSEQLFVDTNILEPLTKALGDEMDNGDQEMEACTRTVKAYDKLIKVYQPTPPDSQMDYIRNFQNKFPVTKPSSLISKIRQTRFLYQRALKTLGRPKHPTPPLDPVLEREFDSAIRNFCYEYLVFERYFGSEKTMAIATASIQKKLSKLFSHDGTTIGEVESAANNLQASVAKPVVQEGPDSNDTMEVDRSSSIKEMLTEEPTKKRKLSDAAEIEDSAHSTKMVKTENSISISEKSAVPMVKIGDAKYPAHPFTVRVSKLAAETEDMDLVDIFRPKCGPIVHAKIMREKSPHHGKGQSKGWGLIQFEERESIDKALALSEVIGIREKLVRVDRSHMPAAVLVPPGMHRVNPKGEGKHSKRNQHHRESKTESSDKGKASEMKEPEQAPAEESVKTPAAAKSTAGTSIFSFKPRGVQQSAKHRKVKVSLSSEPDESKK